MKRIMLAAALCLSMAAHAATITDVRVSGAGPVTFGQVFAAGDLKKSDVLVGAIGTTTVPLQVDVKATHADGSVRHAIISAQVPKPGTMQLNTGGIPALAGMVSADLPQVVASATIGGIKYSASPSGAFKASWLQGPIVNEWQSAVPLTTAAGVAHPHLTARFAIRYYTASKKTRVDVTLENAWAYEPGPQNFTYDADISIAGKSVYSKAGLTHLTHARWRKVFWDGPTVQLNTKYLIASKAVPNYDQSVKIAESVLAAYGSATSKPLEPMSVGLAAPYMPTTGAHEDIGLLPSWAANYALTMDPRAQAAMLVTGDQAGSFGAHYRDKNTDRPVTLTSFPYMTILGRQGDTFNPATKKSEAFPACGGDCASPYTHDTAHQPSLAYLPYLVTGDYYYLEELQFWAMWDAFSSNPGYRQNVKGLFQSDQVRGQAWSLRTMAQAAYITPDADEMKKEFTAILGNNFDWYNTEYSNNASANKLSVILNGYAIVYADIGIAPWQDDFFTSAIGHVLDLGFDRAAPLLAWKSKFPVSRFTTPGLCWLNAAIYSLTIRQTPSSPIFTDLVSAYNASQGAEMTSLECGSAAFAEKLGAKVGDMGNLSAYYMGYPSNLQPALAYAADSGIAGAAASWKLFTSRTVLPDYSLGAQFAIVPRGPAAPPVIVPPAPPKAVKVTTGSNTKLAKQTGLTVVFIDPLKLSLVKSFPGVTATSKGAFTVSDVILQPGAQYLVAVISSAGKPLDAFLLTVPK